jgi:type IV secretory pathway VirB3-like protein
MFPLVFVIVGGVLTLIIGVLVCIGRIIVKKEKKRSWKNRPRAADIPDPNA